jgi:hypothetical protein
LKHRTTDTLSFLFFGAIIAITFLI